MLISTHALHAESDRETGKDDPVLPEFLPTLSMRRATGVSNAGFTVKLHFYPRSPCGERQRHRKGNGRRSKISTHALHAESDHAQSPNLHKLAYFYPRSPCGERQAFKQKLRSCRIFLPTLSMRRATLRILLTGQNITS